MWTIRKTSAQSNHKIVHNVQAQSMGDRWLQISKPAQVWTKETVQCRWCIVCMSKYLQYPSCVFAQVWTKQTLQDHKYLHILVVHSVQLSTVCNCPSVQLTTVCNYPQCAIVQSVQLSKWVRIVQSKSMGEHLLQRVQSIREQNHLLLKKGLHTQKCAQVKILKFYF